MTWPSISRWRSSNFGNIFLCSCQYLAFSSNGSCSFDCAHLIYDLSVSPFLTMSTRNSSRKPVSGKQLYHALMAWLVHISISYYYLHVSLLVVPNDFRSWLQPWSSRWQPYHGSKTGWFIESMYSNHGYSYVAFTKTSIYPKSSSLLSRGDDLAAAFL